MACQLLGKLEGEVRAVRRGRGRGFAVEDGGWLDMSKNTPFAMKETTGKFAFQSCCWREANLTECQLS